MDNQVHNQIVSFIWGIADDCLRDVYVRGKYRDVILPMTVIRRLDALLESSKETVLDMKQKLDDAKIDNQWPALCNAAGQAFCNASPFLLRDLTSRAKKQTLKADFIAYLDGFSPNVQEILEKFKFRNQIDTMIDADILGAVIEKFVSPDINLSPNPVYKDEEKTILKHPGLDNHGMGTIFEELIRKFNEENNEEAGEHWTPRDVVELMADLVFMPVAGQIKDATYSCYDGACGTGGMLTVAQERLQALAAQHGKKVSIHLFGQESSHETYAICKADMLLKGDGEQAEHISFGSTLSLDGNATRQFDFMLSNPPYGKSWKGDAEKMGGKKEILDTRFNTYLKNGDQLAMIPRTSDGQLLFLLNNVAKMKKETTLGSRIAEVHNGSSIFTGDAGSGESNARRYLIENDLVEAIIAVPENMFYNTGIGTFIWILSNKKEERRKGKIIKSGNTYKINDSNNPADEYLAIAAQISDKAGSDVLIAGSSAVQFYSANSFLNTKLELITKDADKIKATLQDLSFKTDTDDNWYIENSAIQIKLSASEETQLYQDVNKIITPYGLVLMVKIEDILLQRISESKDFLSTSEWAEYLLYTHYETVNTNYLREQAALLGCLYNFTQLYKEVNFVRNNSTRELFL